MALKESLREANQLLEHVPVSGKANMRRMLAAMERIESVANAIEEAEKGAAYAEHINKQRNNAQRQLDADVGEKNESSGD